MQLAIITDFEYYAQVVAQLSSEQGWALVAGVAQPQPFEWFLQQSAVDGLLFDLNQANALALLRQITAARPQLPVILLAPPQQIVEVQKAMLAGATAFIFLPISAAQLIRTLEQVRHRSWPALPAAIDQTDHLVEQIRAPTGRAPGKVIAVTSLKGGIGRSTLAVNLAVVLRQQGQGDVILVEAHHGLGHLTVLLNLYPRQTLHNLADVANIDLDLVQGLLQSHGRGLRLLAASRDPAQLVELPMTVWQQVLTCCQASADYVVIDTAARADELLATVLTAADDLLLLIGADIAGLRDGRILWRSLQQEMVVNGRIHPVLNRAGAKGGLGQQVVHEQLGVPVVATLADDLPLATFAFNRGVPFTMSHPHALLSRNVQGLVAHLRSLNSPTDINPPAHRPSLWARLGFAPTHH